MYKKIIFLLLFLLLISQTIFYAHPGRTDSDGGHTEHNTGNYHYHHGYSAHQHKNNECPYDFDDKTDSRSGISTSYTSETDSSEKNDLFSKDPVGFIFTSIIGGLVIIFYIIPIFKAIIEEVIYKIKNK